jgi:DNA-binding GntR family transcriptional regulator
VPQDRDEGRAPIARSATLKQKLVSELIDDIRRGKIAPGSLISAKKLAEDRGVSRTPAREAVDTLATLQLVKWVTNTGARVCEIDLPQLIDLLAARKGVEFRSAQKLGQENAPHKFKALREKWEEMQAAVAAKKTAERRGEAWDDDAKLAFFDLDIKFHLMLAELAGSEDLKYLITYLMNRIRLLAERRMSHPEKTQQEHKAILEAMEGYQGIAREEADENLGRAIELHLFWSLFRWGGNEWAEAMSATAGWEIPPEMKGATRNRDENPKPGGTARGKSRRVR